MGIQNVAVSVDKARQEQQRRGVNIDAVRELFQDGMHGLILHGIKWSWEQCMHSTQRDEDVAMKVDKVDAYEAAHIEQAERTMHHCRQCLEVQYTVMHRLTRCWWFSAVGVEWLAIECVLALMRTY
jgi:hypothetical protein